MSRIFQQFVAAVVLAIAAMTPTAAQDAPPQRGPDVAEFTLDNGLKVLVVNRPGVPVVSSYVWYKVGSMDEHRGITGMAHFLEHMMFKGSERYEVGEVDRVTVRNGGSNNAFTSYDFTAYFIDLPKNRYVEGLKIEADRMRNLTLDSNEFDAEKKVVQSESDIDADDPNRQLWGRMMRALHGPGHPYSHPILGWPQDVQDITRRDMRLFYEKHYHPNHATLVLAGDISADEAKPVVTRLFGSIPRGPEPDRPKPRQIDFKGPKKLEIKSDSPVVQMGRMYVAPHAGHSDGPALEVLSALLGGGVTSRLYRSIVDELGVATGVAAGHSESMLSSTFWMWAALDSRHTRDDLSGSIEKVIARLLEAGVPEAELSRVKTTLVADLLFEQESASAVASTLGEHETVRGDWRTALTRADRIRAVTEADLLRVARQYLRTENSVTGWLVPELTPPPAVSDTGDASAEALPVVRHVLANGLTVLLLERPGLPVLTMTADIRSGRPAEEVSQAGLSQFTGSLLDAGTISYSKQELAEVVESIGGRLGTGAEGVTLRALSEHRAQAVKLLAECMQSPVFPAEEIELLRRATLADIQSTRNETSWFARAAAAAAVFGPDNPLGRPSVGTLESVSAFSRADVQVWHGRWFRPDNCVIAAVGDFSADALLKEISTAFGNWARPGQALEFPKHEFKRPEALEGVQNLSFDEFDGAAIDPKRKRIQIDHPEKDQVILRIQTLGIARDNPDYHAVRVMDAILGTSPGFTDRFSRVLRDQMGLAYSAGANMAGSAGHYPGAFVGQIGTRPENVELALKTMYDLLEEIRNQPVDDVELTIARDYLKGSFVFGLESTGQLAGLMVDMERYGLGFDYMVKFVKGIENVTADDVQRVARKYLVPSQMVEVVCGPVAKITPLEAPVENPESE